MRHQRGFTLVELVIVIAIMSILLVLAVVNLRSSQISARDQERKTDIENIARGLEGAYTYNSAADYPYDYIGDPATTDTTVTDVLRNIDLKSLQAPGVTTGRSLIKATNATETTTGVAPQPSISQYVYQPLQLDGTLCTTAAQECRRYNLYYRLESDNTVYKYSGKNQ